MENIKVTRYRDPKSMGWAGHIEPEDRSWIAFIGIDGRPVFYLNRDPETGAVLSDDPEQRSHDLDDLRTHGASLRTGTTVTADEAKQPLVAVQAGEVVIPLGISGGELEP